MPKRVLVTPPKFLRVSIDVITVDQFIALHKISPTLSFKLREELTWSRLVDILENWHYVNKGYTNDGYKPPKDIDFEHFTDGYGNHVYWSKKAMIYYQEDSSD